ncbi:hypothetical protein BKA70DRAFT_1343046 [Coprinopsis sp. MPI-PUGE-AT-0042]|nr:hypothetical protein BKA70DRAFT_1343046 [Coprinopsis sp. MPI-PUGE-AT-0042]
MEEEIEPTPRTQGEGIAPASPSPADPRYARVILGAFALIAYITAVLWAVASGVAITCASLVIKNNGPFDDRSYPKYREQVYLWLTEAAFDLLLAGLAIRQGVLCSWARKTIGTTQNSPNLPQEPGEEASGFTIRTFRLLGVTSLLNVWVRIRGLWNRRTSLDKTVLCLLVSLGFTISSIMVYAAYDPPAWSYFLGGYYIFTVILIYPFLFIFHRYRTVDVIPRLLARSFACFIFSLLALVWLAIFGSFVVVFVDGVFCHPRSPGPHPLACPAKGLFQSLVLGVLAFLLAFALAVAARTAWASRAGVQLPRDPEDGGPDSDRRA